MFPKYCVCAGCFEKEHQGTLCEHMQLLLSLFFVDFWHSSESYFRGVHWFRQ